jgi:hypothetical protein
MPDIGRMYYRMKPEKLNTEFSEFHRGAQRKPFWEILLGRGSVLYE